MTLRLISGGEANIVASGLGTTANRYWSSVTGSPAISSSPPDAGLGAKCYQFAAAATNPLLKHALPASQTIVYARCYFYITDSTPTSDTFFLVAGSGTANMWAWVTTGGKVNFANGAGTPAVSTITLSDNTLYGIEVQADCHANPHTGKWRLWSAAGGWVDQTATTGAFAATSYADIQFGINSGPTSGTTIYIGHCVAGSGTVLDEDWPATAKDRYVGILRPNRDGTHSFTAGDFGYDAAGADVGVTDTTVYQRLDETDQTSLTDFIRQKVIRTTGYIEVGFESPPGGRTVLAVAPTSTHHASSTGADQMSLKFTDDGGSSLTTIWNNEDVSDTTAHYRHGVVMSTKPSGGAWTGAAINKTFARWGFSGDVTDIPYIDSISLEYEWERASLASKRLNPHMLIR